MRLIDGVARLSSGVYLAVALLTGCDSTSPQIAPVLRIQGEILEGDQPPSPPLDVDILAWGVLGPGGSDSAALRTDLAGLYGAELGPFTDPHVDSLRVRVHQYDCAMQITTDIRRRSLTLGGGDTLLLPTVALSYRLPRAQLGIGGAVCGAIVTRNTIESGGDYASLALWFDELTDSLRGRWQLNHSVSIGDDYGYFSGSLESDRLTLLLRPTQPTPCTGLLVEIPIVPNGSALGPASISSPDGGRTCFVPATTFRFFDGAVLLASLPLLTTAERR